MAAATPINDKDDMVITVNKHKENLQTKTKYNGQKNKLKTQFKSSSE